MTTDTNSVNPSPFQTYQAQALLWTRSYFFMKYYSTIIQLNRGMKMKIVLYWLIDSSRGTRSDQGFCLGCQGMSWMFVKYLLRHVNSLLSYKVELIFIGNVSLDLSPPYGCLSSWSWCRYASSESLTCWTNFIKKGLVLRRGSGGQGVQNGTQAKGIPWTFFLVVVIRNLKGTEKNGSI